MSEGPNCVVGLHFNDRGALVQYVLSLVDVREQRNRTAVNFAATGDDRKTHYANVANSLITRLGSSVLPGMPSYYVAADQYDGPLDRPLSKAVGTPCIRFLDPVLEGHLLKFKIHYGRRGQFDWGVDPDGTRADTPLADLAAVRTHRCALALPAVGERGFLAVERVGAAPVELVARNLTYESLQHVLGRPKDGRPPWWHLTYEKIAAPDRLAELIEKATPKRVKVSYYEGTMRGKKQTLKRELVEKHITLHQAAEVRGAMRQMLGVAGKKERLTGKEAATLLLTALGVDAAGLEFNEGEVVLDDEGREARVTRTPMENLFVHRISGSTSSDPDFYGAVRARVLSLQDEASTDIEWPEER